MACAISTLICRNANDFGRMRCCRNRLKAAPDKALLVDPAIALATALVWARTVVRARGPLFILAAALAATVAEILGGGPGVGLADVADLVVLVVDISAWYSSWATTIS